jgi:cytidylate kinase
MGIVTISRQLGSHGFEIATGLADSMQFKLIDKQQLENRFSAFGLSGSTLERLDEKKPGFWDSFSRDKDKYEHLLRTAILEYALEGNCVILGRGAHRILNDMPCVVRVRLVAAMDERLQRTMERYNCDEAHARRIIAQSDSDRAGFHKFFFDANWAADDSYDLVINTGTLSYDSAIDIIRQAALSCCAARSWELARKRLGDLYLAETVAARILYIEHIPVVMLEVRAADGKINLKGAVDDRAAISRCGEIARAVPGVGEVDNEIVCFPTYAGSMY